MQNGKELKSGYAKEPAQKRFPKSWSVVVKTIGTKQGFPLQSLNVSRSGLLVQSNSTKKTVPFHDLTLVELVIQPDGFHLQSAVHAMGKVVRFASPNGVDREQIAISLIEVQEQDLWDGMMADLELTA